VETHVTHAQTMAELLGPPPGSFLDLGSGAGIPGVVLALAWPDTTGVLLDRRARSAAFLTDAIDRLGLTERLAVAHGRAEEVARDPDLRGTFAVVVARAFGPPAATAECAVGFLAPDGRVAVSEPPDVDPAIRWSAEGLAQLDLAPAEILKGAAATVAVLKLHGAAADRWPRRPGIPTKRPLW
jgi:16S rRNA (guanine527-N7)-methyltransferase